MDDLPMRVRSRTFFETLIHASIFNPILETSYFHFFNTKLEQR